MIFRRHLVVVSVVSAAASVLESRIIGALMALSRKICDVVTKMTSAYIHCGADGGIK